MRCLKITFVFLLAVFSVCIHSFAQQSYLQITVKDTDDLPLPGAPVQLINPDDSSSVYAVTDVNGVALFENFDNGIYILSITYIGYKPINTSLRVTDDIRNYVFIMSTDAISLGGVTITAKKPLIRQEDDMMIIDPEPLANTSTNTLEILESTPGLYVDQDGGIFLTSATPATVYINGREQKMSTQDINTILRSLPPNSVERIEVLRTPSTKYDASSSGGIINIVLKKGVKIGRFGSASAGMNQGIYGNRFVGFSFNNSGDKTTQYLNVNIGNNGRYEEINSVRFLHPDTSLHQSAGSVITSNQVFLGYGLNYEKNAKLSLSYDGRVNASLRNSLSNNDNNIFDQNQTILSEIMNEVNNDARFLSIQQDFGYLKKLDTLGSVLDMKLSYSFNSNASDQNYTTSFTLPLDFAYSGRGENGQSRHFVVFQGDLTYQLPWSVKLETGIKSSWQHFESNADYFLLYNDVEVLDDQRTNAFRYIENINSAYVQASRKLIAGFLLKTGLRIEHTNMQGFQTIPTDTGFVVNRVDLFPYVYLSRKVVEMMGIELFAYMIYRKTIARPGYQDLNPYIRFIDQFLYETGNPTLKPQFTENMELNISFNDMPVFAVGRNFTTDIFRW
jgi:iron complex outermembrane recepter protein